MTAVEYYESLMKVFDRWLEKKEISIDQYNSEKDKLIKQVKEIEKKQIMDAYNKGEFNQGCNGDAEQYYNETFKSE